MSIYPPIVFPEAPPSYVESGDSSRVRSTVQLDVGGTIFKTARSTLTKFDGFFKTMLETGLAFNLDESEPMFIDRDPAHFRLILNFMRDGDVTIPDSEKELMEIRNEAQYYLLSGLHEKCNQKLRQKFPEVTLNIGGTVFHTLKSTLTNCNGFFKTLVESSPQTTGDESYSIFIDRSPKHFDVILNFMRDNDVELPESLREVGEIQKEAQYYFLERLDYMCTNRIHQSGKESLC